MQSTALANPICKEYLTKKKKKNNNNKKKKNEKKRKKKSKIIRFTFFSLVRLKDGADDPGGGAHGSVQHVHKFHRFVHFLGGSVPDPESPALVVSAVGAGHELPVGSGGREPGLQVEFFGGSIVELPRNNINHLVRQPEVLAELLCVTDHLFEGFPRLVVVWRSQNKLLHLLELMHSEDAPRVPAMGPHFLSETVGNASVFQRKGVLGNPFVPVEGGNGLLTRSD